MKNMFPGPVRNQLLKMLNARTDADADIDELNSVLLQVSLAIMLIFMIAFFLFMGKIDGEIEQLDNLKVQLAEAEREQILQAVEKVAEKYRIRYGLKEFLRIDPVTGNRVYEFTDVINKGNLNQDGFAVHAFRSGSAAAHSDHLDMKVLEENWLVQVTELCESAAQKQPVFLKDTVHTQILCIKKEVIEVQTLAAAQIQEHLAVNPHLVKD